MLPVSRPFDRQQIALMGDREEAQGADIFDRADKADPTVVTLEKLALAMGCEIGELFEKIPEGTTGIDPRKSGRRPPAERSSS